MDALMSSTTRVHTFRSILACLLLAGGFTLAQDGAMDPDADRHAHVREMGAEVMPFDVEKTLHSFVKTESGGEQLVVVRDPEADTEQVPIVRTHLRNVSEEFARGDFEDPTTIHGEAMPGLDVLTARFEAVTLRYFSLADGALIVYDTDDGVVVEALHAWFDAQVGDHGVDATLGQIESMTTEAAWRGFYPTDPVPASFDGL